VKTAWSKGEGAEGASRCKKTEGVGGGFNNHQEKEVNSQPEEMVDDRWGRARGLVRTRAKDAERRTAANVIRLFLGKQRDKRGGKLRLDSTEQIAKKESRSGASMG